MPAAAELSLTHPEKRFFLSGDILAAEPVLIRNHRVKPVSIVVDPEHLPGPAVEFPNEEDIFESTRSGWARFGISVKEEAGRDIHREALSRMRNRFFEPFIMKVPVHNFAAQDILLQGTFFRLFTEGPRLKGLNLTRNIESVSLDKEEIPKKPIGISGTFGDDWLYIYDNGEEDEARIVGVYLKIDPNSRLWIPDKPKLPDPLSLPANYRSARDQKQIDEAMAGVPKTTRNILWQAKTTSRLVLPLNIHAVLGKAVVTDLSKKELDHLNQDGKHTHKNSRFLEGHGKTNWRVILEVYGPTDDDISAHYVAVFFSEEK